MSRVANLDIRGSSPIRLVQALGMFKATYRILRHLTLDRKPFGNSEYSNLAACHSLSLRTCTPWISDVYLPGLCEMDFRTRIFHRRTFSRSP